MRPVFFFIGAGILIAIASCSKNAHREGGGDICLSTGPIIVYKTKKDYSNNVPVQLTADKKSLISYPGRGDIRKPVLLANGYYSGVSGNAYLSITLDEYADTNNKYPSDELMKYVIDADPFTEWYNVCPCAYVVGRDTTSLNRIIRHDSLGKCRDLPH